MCCVCVREKDRERQRDRETERQRDREIERQRHRDVVPGVESQPALLMSALMTA